MVLRLKDTLITDQYINTGLLDLNSTLPIREEMLYGGMKNKKYLAKIDLDSTDINCKLYLVGEES